MFGALGEYGDFMTTTDDILKSTIGQHIKNARLRRGLTQTQLAEAAGVSRQSLFAAESGKVCLRADAIHKICETLRVDASWLLCTEPMTFTTDDGSYMYRSIMTQLKPIEQKHRNSTSNVNYIYNDYLS